MTRSTTRPRPRAVSLALTLLMVVGLGLVGAPAHAAPTADAPGWTWEVRGDGVRYVSPRGTFTVPNAGGFVGEHARFGGGRGSLGYPTGPVRTQPNGRSVGTYQIFERGVIYASEFGTYAVKGGASPFGRVHAAHGGGAWVTLGYPTSREVSQGGGYWYQQFDLGTIYVSPRGAFAVTSRPGTDFVWGESFGDAHGLNGGGGGRLGYPVSNVVREGGRYGYQRFERGVVYCGGRVGFSSVCAAVQGGFVAYHATNGGGRGWLGYPIANQYLCGDGMSELTLWTQPFERGQLWIERGERWASSGWAC